MKYGIDLHGNEKRKTMTNLNTLQDNFENLSLLTPSKSPFQRRMRRIRRNSTFTPTSIDLVKTEGVEGVAVRMALDCRAESEEAKALITYLVTELMVVANRKNKSVRFQAAVGAVVADLIKAWGARAGRCCFRPMGQSTFTDKAVGYRGFIDATDAMVAAGYLDRWVAPQKHDMRNDGTASRFKATAKLVATAIDHGVRPNETASHFGLIPRPVAIRHPVVLRSPAHTKILKPHGDRTGGKDFTKGGRHRCSGRNVKFDAADPRVAPLIRQVNEINDAFATVEIGGRWEDGSPIKHHSFRWVFNQRDVVDYSFEWGGKFISTGISYQNGNKKHRPNTIINGAATVEIDVAACHLTIIHALLNKPMTAADTIYERFSAPRDIVKTLIVMTLGKGSFFTRWPSKFKASYREKHAGRDLGKDYPIARVNTEIVERIPLLKDWTNCSVRWGTLHNLESRIIVDCVHELAVIHGVFALPIHDSIRVPASHEALARRVFADCFKRRLGVTPVLTLK